MRAKLLDPITDPEGFTATELDEIERRQCLQRAGQDLVRLYCVWCHKKFLYKLWRVQSITAGDAGDEFIRRPLCIDCVHAVAYRALAQVPMEDTTRKMPSIEVPIRISGGV